MFYKAVLPSQGVHGLCSGFLSNHSKGKLVSAALKWLVAPCSVLYGSYYIVIQLSV